MKITKEELQDYNKNGRDSKLGMVQWVLQSRKPKDVIDIEDSGVKTEREEVMEALDDMGVTYKKNQSTKSLKDLLTKGE